jgi:hypothetical protein
MLMRVVHRNPVVSLVFLAVVLVVALSLRLSRLDRDALWYDEAVSMRIADGPPCDIVRESALDSTPPLYFLGLHYWVATWGGSDAIVRSFSVAWSMAGLLILFGFARTMGGGMPAMAAIVLAALAPLDVRFAQEARMYSQAATLSLAGTWILWEWIRVRRAAPRSALLLLLYALLAWATVMTHYVAATVVLAQGMVAVGWLLARREWRATMQFLGAAAAVAVLGALWFVYVRLVAGGLNRANVAWMPVPPLYDYASFLWLEVLHGQARILRMWLVPIGACMVAAVLACALWAVRHAGDAGDRQSRQLAVRLVFLAWMVAAPVALAAVVTATWQPVFLRARFPVLVLYPFIVFVAVVTTSFTPRLLGGALLAAFGAAMLAGTLNQREVFRHADWRGFAQAWHRSNPPRQVVIVPPTQEVTASRAVGTPLQSTPRTTLEHMKPDLKGREIWLLQTTDVEPAITEKEREYAAWTLSLGAARSVAVLRDIVVTAITVGEFGPPPDFRGRFARWFEPMRLPGGPIGLTDSRNFYPLEHPGPARPYRWSKPEARISLACSDAGGTVTLCYDGPCTSGTCPGTIAFAASRTKHGDSAHTWRATLPTTSRTAETDVVIPSGKGLAVVQWRVEIPGEDRSPLTGQTRPLGIKLYWIGISPQVTAESSDTGSEADGS